MFATPVTGSRNSRPQGLEFRHVLTQLRFQVIDSYASLNEVSLRGISLLGVNSDSSMNIETGALGAWSSPGELAVPGITEVLITGSPTQGSTNAGYLNFSASNVNPQNNNYRANGFPVRCVRGFTFAA